MKARNTTSLTLVLGACLALPFAEAAPASTDPSAQHECVDISQFYSLIATQNSDWQTRKRDELTPPDTSCEHLQLGLLLSHPVVPFQNDAAALDELSIALLTLPYSAVDKRTLGMLIDHVEERQILRNMLGANHRKLRRKQAHIDRLRSQIDRLKNLETQLEEKARGTIDPTADLDASLPPSTPTNESAK